MKLAKRTEMETDIHNLTNILCFDECDRVINKYYVLTLLWLKYQYI
jgi:hypothetical protein